MLIVQLIIFQVFIFVILVMVLRYLFGKNVTKATAHLESLTEEYIKKEEGLRKEYSNIQKKYDETIGQSKKDAAEIQDKAQKEAKEEGAKIIDSARLESENIVKRAENCAEQIKKEINENIERQAIEKASVLIENILPEDIKLKLHEKWVKELIEKGFEHIKHIDIQENVKEAKIISAYVLQPQESNAIKKEIKNHLKQEINFRDEVDSKIIAGVIIKIGSVILDGSISNKIKKIADERKNR